MHSPLCVRPAAALCDAHARSLDLPPTRPPTHPCVPQVRKLFPSASGLTLLWHSVVKIGQSLYREAPGMDPYRPDQRTPIPNFFLAGSYTKQVGCWWRRVCAGRSHAAHARVAPSTD